MIQSRLAQINKSNKYNKEDSHIYSTSRLEMAVRVRGIIASVLLVVFVFMSIGPLLPRHKTEGRVSETNRKFLSFVGWNNPTETTLNALNKTSQADTPILHRHPHSYRISSPDDFRLLIGVMSPS